MPEQAYLHGRVNAPDPEEPKGKNQIRIQAIESATEKTRFDNLFDLPPFEPPGEELIDLGDSMRGDPEDNKQIPSGYTFVALFVDHDITFDPVPEFDVEIFKQVQREQGEEKEPLNFRTPRIDMDSVYGRGPNVDRYLYDRKGDTRKLLIGGTKENPIDVPRNQQNTAIIGDPRNDENLIISQLYLTFLKFHNAIVDYIDEHGVEDESIFEEGADTFEKARQLAIWHYQWIVRFDLLPRIVDPEIIDDIVKNKRKLYRPEDEDREPYIPHEFAVAAYRFGHSQVRTKYQVNDRRSEPIKLFDLFKGDQVTEERAIDWSKFFEINGSQPQYSRKIDTKIAEELHSLPFIKPEKNQSQELLDELKDKDKIQKLKDLAVRNLLRGVDLGLPSGEHVVEKMQNEGIDVEVKGFSQHLDLDRTPLWYYILKESEVEEKGQRLGKVGGRIVAEVLLGLLELDPFSPFYLKADENVKNWQPTLPSEKAGEFTAVDLIKFAEKRFALLPNTLIIEGGEGEGSTSYEFSVSGELQQVEGTLAGRQVSKQANDRVQGNRASGTVSGGADGFRFSGVITDFSIANPSAAAIYVNGEKRDAGEKTLNSLVIDGGEGEGNTSYEFSVSRELQQVEGTLAGRQVSKQANDRVQGNRASGSVSGGADGFCFLGKITQFSIANPSAAAVYVNGEKRDPGKIGLPSTLVIEGGEGEGSTSYEFSVSGELNQVEGTLAGRQVSKQTNDRVQGNRGSGTVSGGADGFCFSGVITDFSIANPSAAAVYVNGEKRDAGEKTLNSLVIDGGEGEGNTSYEFSVSGELQQVEGTLAGRQVSKQANDRVQGNRASGSVSGGADGFCFLGEITDFSIANPSAAAVYVNGERYNP